MYLEFFAPSTPKLLLRGVHSVQFLPTDRVVRIEVSPSRETIAHCRSVASQKSRSSAKTAQQQLQHASLRGSYDAAAIHAHASGVSSGSGANSTNTTHVLKRHGVVAYTGSGVLSEPLAALFVYKGAFASNLFAPPASEINQEGAKMLSAALANRQVLNSRITSSLQAKNMSTILELKALVKQSRLIHLQALTTSAAAGGGGGSIGRAHIPAAVGDAENPAAPSGSAMKDQVIVELPTRAAIKPPFWQLCNTDYLKDVIKRVFHPV